MKATTFRVMSVFGGGGGGKAGGGGCGGGGGLLVLVLSVNLLQMFVVEFGGVLVFAINVVIAWNVQRQLLQVAFSGGVVVFILAFVEVTVLNLEVVSFGGCVAQVATVGR